MAIDKAKVKEIAKLARMKVADKDESELATELNQIFDWIEQLDEVDTEDVLPVTSVTSEILSQRDDKVTNLDQKDKVLANSPSDNSDFYVVPKVVE
ncbi:MAG: Asp-tRNA(Asn)/Glu-tRNA(Gln) amidotransferase GatCAB subunit C [Rhodospirillaceae bacterium]|nr:Asp-tRNA(Asn)/Glu-tRNA(Gln) amidotransferase GatCAB subunit C [Rhodospirillaceae bacterium]